MQELVECECIEVKPKTGCRLLKTAIGKQVIAHRGETTIILSG